jgi:hypothetical protein
VEAPIAFVIGFAASFAFFRRSLMRYDRAPDTSP